VAVTETEKEKAREAVWTLLERKGEARFPGARGRIPNFRGAEDAARRLADLPAWRAARVIKANPDAPQLPARALALDERKRLYMAVPRLRDRRPFLFLDGDALAVPARRAASIRGASSQGGRVRGAVVEPIDVVLCGSVAVDRRGARVGKGGGYSDLELALLAEAGRITARTAIVTTVHPLQIVEERLPETGHDFRVDRIVTPDEVIRCRRARRPRGILWDHLDQEKIDAVPALAALRRAD
jgi:5-formyltetrahydrofolate cyclo-ligase